MKTSTVTKAKLNLSALIVEVEAGQEVVITRRGKQVARLIAEPGAGGFGWPELRKWVANKKGTEATIATWNDFNTRHGSFAD